MDEMGVWDNHSTPNKWNVQSKLNSMGDTTTPQHTPIIAIDFDGTIVDHEFPRIGKLLPGAKEVINEWYDKGYFILIWTCRNNYEPDHPEWDQAPIGAVTKFLEKNGVKFHGINQQQPGLGFYLESRKIFANVYIDDRNLGGFPGWSIAHAMVEKHFALGGTRWDFYAADLFKKRVRHEVEL
jgi:hypothetical protein